MSTDSNHRLCPMSRADPDLLYTSCSIMNDTRKTDIVIIGGGLSGLFLASALKLHKFSSFILIDKAISNMGGYATRGWVKIGLFPAGKKTADKLDQLKYERLSNDFINRFSEYLIHIPNERINIHFEDYELYNKHYSSLIMSHVSIKQIVKKLISEIGSNVTIGEVTEINRINNRFFIVLDNGTSIDTKSLVIASGRDPLIYQQLTKLGEIFSKKKGKWGDNPIISCQAEI